MRRFTTLTLALALVVAACTSSGSTSSAPSQVPATAAPATAAPAQVTPAPTATPVAIAATVTFDGQTCVYAGPSVIPRGASVTFKLTNTPAALKDSQGAALLVMPVVDGTTWDRILADVATYKQSEEPPWVFLPDGVGDREVQILYPSSATAGATLTVAMHRNAYLVDCGTSAAPETDRAYPAILLNVLTK